MTETCPTCGQETKPVNIVCILDRSGSMYGLMDDMVGAFNGFIKEQKAVPGEALLTLVAFDNYYDIIHNRTRLHDVPELSRSQVEARGSTALLDAIGKTISGLPDNERTICLIQTDGHENASHEYTRESIKKMVEQKTKAGWEFIFTAANVDAFAASAGLGFDPNNVFNYQHSQQGYVNNSAMFSCRSTMYRGGMTSDPGDLEDNAIEETDVLASD